MFSVWNNALICQVDNHLSDGVYPVLLGKKEETEYFNVHEDPTLLETPFLEMTIIRELDNVMDTIHYNYVAFRCDGFGGGDGGGDRMVQRV